MFLTLPEGGLAPLPSCGKLTSKGLFLSMMEVLGFPAIFSLDVLITPTQLSYPCTAKVSDSWSGRHLGEEGLERLCGTLHGSRGASGLQCMLYHTLAGNWAFF